MPYHESDHVLNIAYNALCDGNCLQDLELRRQDEAYLDALGAAAFPIPPRPATSAAALSRNICTPHGSINVHAGKVWASNRDKFFDRPSSTWTARWSETTGECKQGMDISYDGQWGYHPLVVTLANTGEVLRLVNRRATGRRTKARPPKLDEALPCAAGGFRTIVLRGDTDFSQTRHLDRWHEQEGVTFCFGLDVDGAAATCWPTICRNRPGNRWNRPAEIQVRTRPRKRPSGSSSRWSKTAASRTFDWSMSGWARCRIAQWPAGTRIV